jgi:uncharacterized membrane protein YfhO
MWVNGRERPFLRANHAFRAVALEAGTYRIAFRYAPRTAAYGIAASFAGLILAAITLAFIDVKKRIPEI